MSENIELLPVLLNGKSYTLDPTSTFAINTEGQAVALVEAERESRFR